MSDSAVRSVMNKLNYSILLEHLININHRTESSDATKIRFMKSPFIIRLKSVRIRRMQLRLIDLESCDYESVPVAVRISCNRVIFLFKSLRGSNIHNMRHTI